LAKTSQSENLAVTHSIIQVSGIGPKAFLAIITDLCAIIVVDVAPAVICNIEQVDEDELLWVWFNSLFNLFLRTWIMFFFNGQRSLLAVKLFEKTRS
jgi:hypothetical protein